MKLSMERSIDRRTNGSVHGYISVSVSKIERSGLGVRKEKKIDFKENVHPLHVFLKKLCTPFSNRKRAPPTRFLFRKRASPHTFYLENVHPPYTFYLENMHPHTLSI